MKTHYFVKHARKNLIELDSDGTSSSSLSDEVIGDSYEEGMDLDNYLEKKMIKKHL